MADRLRAGGAPLLLAFVAVLALLLQRSAAEQQKTEAQKAGPPPPPVATATPAPPPPSPPSPIAGGETARLLAELLNETAGEGAAPPSPPALVDEARARGYAVESLIALVPDPVESRFAANFDQALDAIQRAHAAAGYLLDRFWLPWSDPADVKAKRYRDEPGILLFRQPADGKPPRLQMLFVVGEASRAGVQKGALARALEQAVPSPDPERRGSGWVRILGPSFSGSAESLRLVLLQARRQAPAGQRRFWIVTGSATAPGLESFLARGFGADLRFTRTVVPDDRLQEQAYRFLERSLGWDLRKAALLVESDTAYGQGAGKAEAGRRLVRVPVPSRLSALRAAWEKSAPRSPLAPTGETSDLWRQFSPPELADVSLAEAGQPADGIPEVSPLTAPTNDLALANLLSTLCREGFRYVGVLTTDVRDRLYLIHRLREFCPDVLAFTFDNHLLYAYPRFGEDLDGTLVIGSSPLYTEGAAWLPGGEGPGERIRRQFSSEYQEGVFAAVSHLLAARPGSAVRPAPSTWIAAVGNGSLWPIARLPARAYVRTAPAGEPGGFDGFGTRIDLKLVLFAIAIGALLWGLQAVALPVELAAGPDGGGLGTWGLLALGTFAVWLASAVTLVLVNLPLWGFALPQRADLWPHLTPPLLRHLLLPCAAYLGLLWLIARLPWPLPTGMSRRARVITEAGTALVSLLLLVVIARLLQRHWMSGGMPGGAEFFHLRVRRFSSGLSPLADLALLGGAVYLWSLLELKRRRLIVWHRIDWPLADLCEPPFRGCAELARQVDRQLEGTWLPGTAWKFWLILLVALGPALFTLQQVQPVAETKDYGQLFLFMVLTAFLMSAVSFYRFVKTWRSLQRVLQRLDHARLGQAFQKISPEVGWSPMQSFGWQIPGFKLQVLSVRHLQELTDAGKLDSAGLAEEAEGCLAEAFEAERRRDEVREVHARRELRRIFDQASQELEGRIDDPDVDAYRALRTVAFLRHVFAHLRNCLMAAMGPALLLLAAVSAYTFEPKRFLSSTLWVAILGAVLVTLWIFIQMDRNATLSTIGGTTPGRISFGRDFFATVFTYGIIPLLGLLAVKFPQMGHYFVSWVNPLLRVFGTR